MTQIPDNLIATFIDLCNPFCSSLSALPSGEDWHSISELSKLHGVTPFLYYRTRSLGIKLPEQIEKKWLGFYLYQIAEEQKARRQIMELKEILGSEGIPIILLKGASTMLRLYPQPGLRTFVDLDILIPDEEITKFKYAMSLTDYRPLSTMNSPEDEYVRKFERHLDPFRKEEGLMIEPHLSVLGVGSDHLINLPEMWQEKEETNSNGIKVCHLSRERFIVHTMFHFL